MNLTNQSPISEVVADALFTALSIRITSYSDRINNLKSFTHAADAAITELEKWGYSFD